MADNTGAMQDNQKNMDRRAGQINPCIATGARSYLGVRIMSEMNVVSFDGKPPVEVRDALKAYGYRWDRCRKVWTAYRSIASAAVCDYFRGGYTGFDAADLDEMVSMRGMEAACGII